MENFVDKAIRPEDIAPDGPFDVCIDCPNRAVACSGPRTTAMTHERYVEWLRRLFDKWSGTRQDLADKTGVSKSTIDDLFAGRRKDISRATAGLLENELIGGDGKWACAALISKDMDVVYEDRPETLEALRVSREASKHKSDQIESMRRNYEELKEIHAQEIQRTKDFYEKDIEEYRELVTHLRTQLDRKDDYIDRLAKKAGI